MSDPISTYVINNISSLSTRKYTTIGDQSNKIGVKFKNAD